MSVLGGYGLTRVIDSLSRFQQPGNGPAFLRVKNFADAPNPQTPINAQLGFAFTPTASGALTGFTDYQIDPPPVMRLLSMHNIGQAAAAGIKLFYGARDILISDTFVRQQMALRNFTDPKQVFEDATTLGIIANGIVIDIVSCMPDYAYGSSITWSLLGNANEIR